MAMFLIHILYLSKGLAVAMKVYSFYLKLPTNFDFVGYTVYICKKNTEQNVEKER